jgi:hypothetical protein
MKMHELKTDPIVFAESLRGDKPFEIRFDDRGILPGDLLILKETQYTGEEMRSGKPMIYTGRALSRIVTNKTTGYGLLDGWAIFGVREV